VEAQEQMKKDYSKLNFVKHIQRLENYRGHKTIIFYPAYDCYMGYMDDDFFAFQVPKNVQKKILSPTEVVDYYKDKIFLKSPEIDFNTFVAIERLAPFMNAVRFVYDQEKKMKNGNTDKIKETT